MPLRSCHDYFAAWAVADIRHPAVPYWGAPVLPLEAPENPSPHSRGRVEALVTRLVVRKSESILLFHGGPVEVSVSLRGSNHQHFSAL